eukprot:TRINITY_DN1531_c0_g1_i4.p1 TRINITY_DN1531_c0_g1~~TRINITY_DN1531_c0_g1_i4.p1  ORF type:complete len:381 (-),score=49.37 TRINITY_DN1531_c0_g1_i4:105-1109(-)
MTSLTLSGAQMARNGRNAFCEWFPKRSTLTDLNIVNVFNSFGGAEQCLKTHGKLQRFTFHNARYQSVGREALSLLESLSFNKDLRYLDLSTSFCDKAYSVPISQLIESLPLLTELNLRDNILDHNLSEALRTSKLTTLNLSDSLTEGDMVRVCEALHDHPTITWLNIGLQSSVSAMDIADSAIGKLLQTQIPLQSLYFNGDYNNNCDLVDIAKSLKNNHTLTFLSVNGNECKNKGAIAFAECLGINTTLTELDLSGNGIGVDGVIAIAKSLEKNTSLKMLDISNNHINNKGFDCLLHMLDINMTLKQLRVNGCQKIEKGQETRAKEKYGERISV